jgi:hypothetical protein
MLKYLPRRKFIICDGKYLAATTQHLLLLAMGAEALSLNEFTFVIIIIFGINILTFGQLCHFTLFFSFLEKN